MDLPKIEQDEDQEEWTSYESYPSQKPGATSTTFNQVASLSKIVNSTLLLFFAPTCTFSGYILLTEYQKYLDWRSKLPDLVASTENAPPHVLCLQ